MADDEHSQRTQHIKAADNERSKKQLLCNTAGKRSHLSCSEHRVNDMYRNKGK